MPNPKLTLDQKQVIRRNMAASTVRQLSGVLLSLAPNTMSGRDREMYTDGAEALQRLANRIEQGQVNQRHWEFLTWLAEPKVDLDSLVPPATSASSPSSGLRTERVVNEYPSIPIPSPTPEDTSPESSPPWSRGESTS
jgi:hypothetical protein